MLARTVLPRNATLQAFALPAAVGPQQLQARNAATLKEVKGRMRSVENLKKITKAMKMVAAAKLRQDQRRLENGQYFAKPVESIFQRIPREEKSGPLLLLGLTSDKGLCGGVNTFVSKEAKKRLEEEETKGNTVKYMCMGGKGIAAIKRLYGDRLTTTFEETAKVPWSFGAASLVAERIIAADPERLKVVGNVFKSAIAYDTTEYHYITKKEAHSMDRAEWSKAMDVYSFEPALYEVFDDLHEFYYGAAIYGAYLNSQVAEQSSRMAAMENASKNAGEMLEKLSLIYNRARQAKITTELCEIISGASAV